MLNAIGNREVIMSTVATTNTVERLRGEANPITGSRADYNLLIESIGDARYVLLGEATHGTHEFYKARAQITKRLIVEKGFTVIAWEADWPDALRIHRYIQGRGKDQTAEEALGDFKRFPRWMWRNADILDLVGWLRAHNDQLAVGTPKVGVYGLDLYSLYSSIEAVIHYLDKHDPQAAREARHRYSCFEHFGDDPQSYGMTASVDLSLSCEREVIEQLMELQQKAAALLSIDDGRVAAEELFYAEQNAIVAREAERYYRAMYHGRPNTWNLRDTHMVNTLERLMEHLRQQGENPKAVLWAHNSHLGDARATTMQQRGELNVGQLVRERHAAEVMLIGFTTFSGTVTAASEWDEPPERKTVRPGMEGSWERLFHEVSLPAFLLRLRDAGKEINELNSDLLERAIGVIYLPETERWSHYFYARVSRQFDAVIHFDETRALEPLERTVEWEAGELPETYPFAV
jgi:erythromycin esterase-like protein